ncbi:MAG: sulfurtransferase TusA family protein [bacterium]
MLQDYNIMETGEYLDLRGEVCPFTFVKTKLALERINKGEIMMVTLDNGQPLENVPRSLKEEGHQIIKVKKTDNGAFNLWVKKG